MRSRHRLWSALLVASMIALGVAVRPAALDMGFAADDFAQLAMLEGAYPVARAPSDLFNFGNGSRSEVETLVQSGVFPWWSHPEVRLSMWRPLSSLLMGLDLRLFGNWAFGYHLHSLLWWSAMVIVVAILFGRLLPAKVAMLSLLLFVLDESHGVLLGWIANRNALCSTFFALLALLGYIRFRERPSRWGWVFASAGLCVALGFGEYALTMLGYAVAYELLCGRGSFFTRARSFAVLGVPVVSYLGLRAALGYGPMHSGIYVDPFSEPGEFLNAALHRFPIFFGDLLATVRSDYWTFGMPYTDWLYRHGFVGRAWLWSPEPWRATQLALGSAAMVGFGLLWWAVRRGSGSTRGPSDWLALGSLLSVAPAIAPFPSSRLLVVPVIGVCALIAALATQSWTELRTTPIRANSIARACVALSLLALHLFRPPTQSWAEMRQIRDGTAMVRRAVSQMEIDPRVFTRQHLVVLSAEDAGAGFYLPVIRARLRQSVPSTCWVLSGSSAPFWLTREDARTLRIDFVAERSALTSTYETMFRSNDDPLRSGQVFALDGLRVEVLAVRNHKPVSVRFTFGVELEHDSLYFVHAEKNGLRRFIPPAVGRNVWVEGPVPPALMVLGR